VIVGRPCRLPSCASSANRLARSQAGDAPAKIAGTSHASSRVRQTIIDSSSCAPTGPRAVKAPGRGHTQRGGSDARSKNDRRLARHDHRQFGPSDARTVPIHEILLDLINASTTQPRQHLDEDPLRDLAASIQQHGVLQAIIVRPIGRRWEIGRNNYTGQTKRTSFTVLKTTTSKPETTCTTIHTSKLSKEFLIAGSRQRRHKA
jgi:hypothetical protein